MKKFIILITATIVCFNAVSAQDKPLRLAIAGLSHGHLGDVAWRIDRNDFVIVGIAENRQCVAMSQVRFRKRYVDYGFSQFRQEETVVIAQTNFCLFERCGK